MYNIVLPRWFCNYLGLFGNNNQDSWQRERRWSLCDIFALQGFLRFTAEMHLSIDAYEFFYFCRGLKVGNILNVLKKYKICSIFKTVDIEQI